MSPSLGGGRRLRYRVKRQRLTRSQKGRFEATAPVAARGRRAGSVFGHVCERPTANPWIWVRNGISHTGKRCLDVVWPFDFEVAL